MSRKTPVDSPDGMRVRLDKWLWAARFYKTRALAHEAIEAGRVRLAPNPGMNPEPSLAAVGTNQGRPAEPFERSEVERVKPSRDVRVGDCLILQMGYLEWVITVLKLSERRGPACEARELYVESEASRDARLRASEQRRLMVEPGASIRGRPSKKDARLIHRFTESH